MKTTAPFARKGLLKITCLALAAMLGATAQAQDMSASMDAAAKAAAAARAAATSALNAAKAASDTNLSREAIQQALRAAEAAQEAAAASEQVLEAARKAAEAQSAAPATAAAPAAAAPAAQASTAAPGGAPPYEGHVQCKGKDCQVDLWMVRGFRAFSQCQVCHGLDGNGSSFAPSLVAKLKEIDRVRFDDVVINGYKGQVGVMPPWKDNPNVMKYLDQLYGYVKARSDGVLPPGRLKRYDR